MIRRYMLAASGLLLLTAHTAAAQDKPQDKAQETTQDASGDANDLYDAARARYLADVDGQALASLHERQANFMTQTADTIPFWWGVWEKHQPYSKDITYSVPAGIMDIPTDPSLTSTAAYGRDLPALVYGNNPAPTRSAADAIVPDYQAPADNSENIKSEAKATLGQ